MANSLNKVVEQVAYKQVEDLIVYLEMLSEQIISTSKTAKANQISFGTPASSNNDMNKKLAESQAIIKQLQKEYKLQQDALEKLTKKVDEHAKAKAKMTQEGRNAIIDAREERKILDGNAVANSNLTTYIQKLTVERAKASRIVADYNAQIAMGNKLTEEQSQELSQATAQFQKYDNAIKAGKKSIGDAREFVGQYERANTGLSNSINQIARELPAATFGFQTFALGISNNIPIAVDEIKNAVAINKELIAQGKPTVSVWKQVGSAILSFNSIMSVGLLLLALFGKEIANFTKELFGADTALETVTNRQKEFNKARLEGKKDAQTDIIELRKYLAVVKDRTIADDLRQVALKKLRADYPYYFKNLTDEQILTGKTSEAVKQLTKDLEKRKEVEKKTDLNVLNRQRLIDLEKEIQLNKSAEKQALKNLEIEQAKPIINDRATAQAQRIKMSEAERLYENAIQKTAKTQKEIDFIQKNTIKNEEDIFKLKTETIALEYQDIEAKDKNTKSIRLNTKAREDYLVSEYELWKLRKTNESNLNKEIMDDEASGYELRLMASEQYYQNQLDLANRQAQEELRILEFTTKDRLRTIQNEFINIKEQRDNELSQGKISREDYNRVMKDAEDNLQYDRTGIIKDATNQQNIIYENQAQNLINVNKELVGVMAKAWDEVNFQKADIEIANIDLKNIEKLKEALSGISEGMSVKEIEDVLREINIEVRKNTADINLREDQLELDRKERDKARIEREIIINGQLNNLSDEHIQNQIVNNKTLLDLDEEIIKSKKRVLEADNQVKNAEIDNIKELQQRKEDYNAAVLDSTLRLTSDIGNLGNQLFQNNIDRYDREIEKSNEYYDSLLENAEKGSEQEQLLQEDKARKEEELQKKRVQQQRKQALFNKMLAIAEIALNLQQEIAKNSAMTGTIGGALLTPVAIASAAIRTATVLATPLPQYKDGRGIGKNEFAVVGDGGVSEVIERENGKIEITPNKPTITHLKSKDIVHKSLEDFNKSKLDLENASIMASFANKSNQLKAFDYYLGKELNGLPNKIEKSIEKGFKKVRNNINVTNKIDLDHLNYKNRGFNA